MARIILGSTMVRYPVGGIHLWVLSFLLGFQRLGHEVYLVEKSGWPSSCYDLSKRVMTDDCSYGVSVVNGLLRRFRLDQNWCFVDAEGRYHGLSRQGVQTVFKSADLFVDFEGTEWLEEAAEVPLRVMIDSEPGWCQIKMEQTENGGQESSSHHYYYTIGRNIGTDKTSAPTGGKTWKHIFPPVLLDLAPYSPANVEAPYTTVMNWKSHKHVEFNGVQYGQKETEFARFIDLPLKTSARMQIAVSGSNVPRDELRRRGWSVLNADDVSISLNSYQEYLFASKGEFAVAKHVFVATNSGWFGHQQGYYLSSGRPVVLDETGFSAHLPVGSGLFAVRNVEEAAQAIGEINSDFNRHSRRAREIAEEFLDAPRVLASFLEDVGV
jgi:hypothetical protein